MARVTHGSISFSELNDIGSATFRRRQKGLMSAENGADPASPSLETGFTFMFPNLQSDAHRLPAGAGTIEALIELAKAMSEASDDAAGDSTIPAHQTYFGQFIDHDITRETFILGAIDPEEVASVRIFAEAGPVPDASAILMNQRTGPLDLDSVYGGPVHTSNPNMLELGSVTDHQLGRPVGKDDFHDVPRLPPNSNDAALDRAARIGDPRNDENLVISQLHLAFLRAHNSFVDDGLDREGARNALGNLYLDAVFNDFLAHVCEPSIRRDIMDNGRTFWSPDQITGDIPLEFTLAAYRFGHSMVRANYEFNVHFSTGGTIQRAATFRELFTFARLKGTLGGVGNPSVPENWIIEWDKFTDGEVTRKIDTRLTPEINDRLPGDAGETVRAGMRSLGERNLLKGYATAMPTGQAVARAMGLAPLAGVNLLNAVPVELRAAAMPFMDRSPLWFYILAEAGDPSGPKGATLGPVGSRIVCETLHALAEASDFEMPEFSETPNGALDKIIARSDGLVP